MDLAAVKELVAGSLAGFAGGWSAVCARCCSDALPLPPATSPPLRHRFKCHVPSVATTVSLRASPQCVLCGLVGGCVYPASVAAATPRVPCAVPPCLPSIFFRLFLYCRAVRVAFGPERTPVAPLATCTRFRERGMAQRSWPMSRDAHAASGLRR